MFQHMDRSHDLTTGLKERYIIIDRTDKSISLMDSRALPTQFKAKLEKAATAQAEVEVPA